MVTVKRTEEYLSHAGVKGMKWGYNDGKRNGRRTATELQKLQEIRDKLAKQNGGSSGSGNIEKDYDEANNMLKYLGISLDLHSDDQAVAQTMNVYETMRDSKDKYDSQYEWLKAFSSKLSAVGYDMGACDKYLAENKDKLNEMRTGTGSGEASTKKETTSKSSTKKNNPSTSKKATDSKTSEKKKNTTKIESVKKPVSNKKPTSNEAMKNRQKENSNKLKTLKKSTSSGSKTSSQTRNAYSLYSAKHSYDENQNGEELYHHGILGQKWGVRRYQNSDGTLTDEGRKRYSNMSDNELRSKLDRKRLENRYKDLKVGRGTKISGSIDTGSKTASKVANTVSGEKSDASKITNSVGQVAKDAGKIADKAMASKANRDRKNIDLSEMSTDELRKAVNRMQMEQELSQLDSRDVINGKKIATDTLQNIGLVASTAVDVITLAVLINKVLNK